MRPTYRLLVAAFIAAALPFSGVSAAPADKKIAATPGGTTSWFGTVASGTALENMVPAASTPATAVGGQKVGPVTVEKIATVDSIPVSDGVQCTHDPNAYCETVLLSFDLALTEQEIAAGKTRKKSSATVSVGDPALVAPDGTRQSAPAYDFDIALYESNAAGDKVSLIKTVGDLDETPGEESYSGIGVEGTSTAPVDYVLLEVIYFSVVNGNYKGTVTTTNPRLS